MLRPQSKLQSPHEASLKNAMKHSRYSPHQAQSLVLKKIILKVDFFHEGQD